MVRETGCVRMERRKMPRKMRRKMRIPSNTDDGFPVIGVESVFSWGYQACMLRSQAPISVAAIAVTGRSF